MKKALVFLKRYWYIPLILIVSLLGWIFFRRRGTPLAVTMAEIGAIDAEKRAEEAIAREGAAKALLQVEQEYAAKLQKLNEKQKKQAKELRDDPAKLAKFLFKVGR